MTSAAGFILGILGTALALIPLIGVFFAGLPALLAVILGFLALSNSRRTGLRRGESIASIVLGFAPLAIVSIFFGSAASNS